MSEVSNLIAAVAALITAVAGLIVVLRPRLTGSSGTDEEQNAYGGVASVRPHVSRRTTISLTLGLIAAVLAVILVLIVSFAGDAGSPALNLVLLLVIGLLAWPGAALGIERAWTAWSTHPALAVNAAAGTAVGLTAWISALVATAQIW